MSTKLVMGPGLSLPLDAATDWLPPVRAGAEIPDCADLAGLLRRFASYLAPEPTTGCWLWTGANIKGYGILHLRSAPKRRILSHRLSYLLWVGDLRDGESACHTCDTPPCCCPWHLFAGSQLHNMADSSRKGRLYGRRVGLGERQHLARLTSPQVLAIRARAAAGERVLDLAREHGFTYPGIKAIIDRKTWKHI